MAKIQYFEELPGFKLKNKRKVRTWLHAVAKKEEYHIQELSYIFCSDDYLLEINEGYLQHDDYTDIITFDLSGDGDEGIVGEIYISVERVKENAISLGEEFEVELRRVIAHGLLHLCGYRDKTKAEAKIMRAMEDKSLKLWQELFHVEQ